MASASYYLGEKLYSEYDREWKYPHSDPDRVVYTEVMLPPNAPQEYADHQTLWNAVDAAEKQANAQTARKLNITLPRELTFEQNLELIRDYCQRQFVDKGMICDLFFHDSGNGNPHVHLMLTLRAMDEQGRWLPKTRTEYVLDDFGQRIRMGNGKWKRQRIDTVDWNDQKYCEIWRHEWELAQNEALEKAGRPERVDMRSFERQGITDQAPQKHLGPAASALERKGIHTQTGDENREIVRINSIIRAAKKSVYALTEWVNTLEDAMAMQAIIENPKTQSLPALLTTYLDLQKQSDANTNNQYQTGMSSHDEIEILIAIRRLENWQIDTVGELGERLNAVSKQLRDMGSAVRKNDQRSRDITAILDADMTIRKHSPLVEKYNKFFFKGQKEKFAAAHADEFNAFKKAKRLLHKLDVSLPIDRKALRSEVKRLNEENESKRPMIESIRNEMSELMQVRKYVRKVIPDALSSVGSDSPIPLEQQMESVTNKTELEHLLDRAADNVLRQRPEQITPALPEMKKEAHYAQLE